MVRETEQEEREWDTVRTAEEAAKFLRVSTSWLAKARGQRKGPPYVKLGRSIRYLKSALIQWMQSKQE